MRPDFGHNQKKSYAQRRDEARGWAERVGHVGPLLVDSNNAAFLHFGENVIPSWARPKTTGEKPAGWGYMYILNTQAQIVYQHGPDPSFRYHEARFVLDRLLDATFDEACRNGFPDKSAALPIVQSRVGGVTYADDFDSYKNSYDFKLQPCWGFRRRNALTCGSVAKNVGRDGSQAAVICGDRLVHKGIANIEHIFPRPLEHGHLRCYVRRGPAGWDKKKPRAVFCTTLYGAGTSPVGRIQARGVWKKEQFSIDEKTAPIELSHDDWHEIRITVRPDVPMEILIDNEEVARLPTRPLTGVGLNAGDHGAYLDDFEVTFVD